MVTFNQKPPNYYVRDPRQAQLRPSTFYNDFYGRSTNPTRVPYNPTAYNPGAAPVGVAGGVGPNPYPVNGPYYQGALGYTSNRVNVPGLNSFQNTFVSGLINGLASSAGVLTQINPIKNALSAAGIADSVFNRLTNNNLPAGAEYATQTQETFPQPVSTVNGDEDLRVIISDPSGKLIRGNITKPLEDTGGVLFPYTPTISINHRANYSAETIAHTNYQSQIYQNSDVDSIRVEGKFTANDGVEAAYVMAVIHFFRAATKMFYGQDSIAGTPPPILRLNGYGNLMLDNLPVVVEFFSQTLPDDVDYISASIGNNTTTLIPTNISVSIGLKIMYSRNQVSNTFGLEKFVTGGLITGRKPGDKGAGGFI
jgi:hypothetical protein